MRDQFLLAAAATAAAVSFSSATLLPAQTRVLPPEARNAEANAQQRANWRGPRLHQVLYSAALTTGVPAQITQVRLRPDASSPSLQRDYDVTILMSSQGVPSPERASRTDYAANHGSDATLVLQPRRVQFPAMSAAAGPQPLLPAIPLDTPFAFHGPNNLLVEIGFTPAGAVQDPNPYALDALVYPTATWGLASAEIGTGCPRPGKWQANVLNLGGHEQLSAGYQSDASPSLQAVVGFGLGDQTIGSLPLPLDLGPLGAPGCSVYHDMIVTVPGYMSATGGGSVLVAQARVPRNFGLTGLTFFVQGLILDPQGNALGLRATSGLRLQLQTPPTAYHALLLHGAPGAPVEVATPNMALVLGLN